MRRLLTGVSCGLEMEEYNLLRAKANILGRVRLA